MQLYIHCLFLHRTVTYAHRRDTTSNICHYFEWHGNLRKPLQWDHSLSCQISQSDNAAGFVIFSFFKENSSWFEKSTFPLWKFYFWKHLVENVKKRYFIIECKKIVNCDCSIMELWIFSFKKSFWVLTLNKENSDCLKYRHSNVESKCNSIVIYSSLISAHTGLGW